MGRDVPAGFWDFGAGSVLVEKKMCSKQYASE